MTAGVSPIQIHVHFHSGPELQNVLEIGHNFVSQSPPVMQWSNLHNLLQISVESQL